MPFFKYVAKDQFGESISGKVEARNIHSAANELSSRKLLVVQIQPLTEDSFAFITKALVGVKQNDVVNFTRQLSTMISAGLPLATSLSILVQQSKSEMSRLVASILQDVEGGMSFAEALSKHPEAFDPLYVQLVRAGEIGGVLDDILLRLADNMEKAKEFRSKTRGAMIYPAIVLITMAVVAAIMMIFVIPKLTEMYADFGAQLPIFTRILIGTSQLFVQSWYIMVGVIIVGVFLFRRWISTDVGKHSWHGFLLKVPVLGDIQKKVILTEFTRTLSLLLGAGISLLQALQIVTNGVTNVIYKEAMQDSSKQVEKGVALSKSLSVYEAFPPILHQMMAVGEETGKMDEVLGKLSNYFEQESEQAIKNMTTLMEPLIMIVLGIGVGIMVIAVIMPIYNLTSQF